MTAHDWVELALAYAPHTEIILSTICFGIKLWFLKNLAIIKPTSR